MMGEVAANVKTEVWKRTKSMDFAAEALEFEHHACV